MPPVPPLARTPVLLGLASAVLLGSGMWYGPDQRGAAVAPQMVYRQARQWTEQNPYPGVTGEIWFDRDGIATHKYLSLLCTLNIKLAYSTESAAPYEVDSTGPVTATCHRCSGNRAGLDVRTGLKFHRTW